MADPGRLLHEYDQRTRRGLAALEATAGGDGDARAALRDVVDRSAEAARDWWAAAAEGREEPAPPTTGDETRDGGGGETAHTPHAGGLQRSICSIPTG